MRFNYFHYDSFGLYPHSFDYSESYTKNRADLTETISAWCTKQFGEPGARWYYNPMMSAFRIALNDDAFAFRMRWC